MSKHLHLKFYHILQKIFNIEKLKQKFLATTERYLSNSLTSQQLVEKIKQLDPSDVRRDLEPFIQSPQTVTSFSEHFGNILFAGAKSLAGK